MGWSNISKNIIIYHLVPFRVVWFSKWESFVAIRHFRSGRYTPAPEFYVARFKLTTPQRHLLPVLQ